MISLNKIHNKLCFFQENIVLTLPTTKKVSNVKWLSVWCRYFEISFGDLIANFDVDEASEPRNIE